MRNLILSGLVILAMPFLSVQAGLQAPAHTNGRALLVGINQYKNFPQYPTPGAEEDAIAMKEFIQRKYGFRDEEIHSLIGSQATAAQIVAEFQSWLIAGTRPGERVFFLYSGHGTRVEDEKNGDEADHEDEALAPYDVGEGGRNLIRDDVFNRLLGELSGRMVVMVFDSCHSGTISRGGIDPALRQSKSAPPRYLPSPAELAQLANAGTRSRGSAAGDEVIVPLQGSDVKSRDLHMVVDRPQVPSSGIVIFSAAHSGQRAFPIRLPDGSARGALSLAFTESQEKKLPVLRELRSLITDTIQGWQQAGRLNREQQPVCEVLAGSQAVSLEDQPLFGAAHMAQVLAEGNPAAGIKLSLHLEQNKRRFRVKEPVSYRVESNTDGYLYLLVFSQENTATCIFPNTEFPGDHDNFIDARSVRVPRRADKTFYAQLPIGKDIVVALLSKAKLPLGEKEAYTWEEIFSRLRSEKFFEYVKTRGIGTGQKAALGQADWQAVSLQVETIE